MSSHDSSDPHQGGDLSDMAATGATMPNDAGQMNILPSVPRPGQDQATTQGSASLIDAADNTVNMPRSTGDTATGADVMTAYGDTMPATIDSKRMDDAPGGVSQNPAAKGHSRDDKAGKHKEADQDRPASDAGEAEAE